MYANSDLFDFSALAMTPPDARAVVRGDETHPRLLGRVNFYQTDTGVLVCTQFQGLPDPAGPCRQPIFAFHIHSGGACTGSPAFSDAGSHYDPGQCPHPYHAGDLPPLFGAQGQAYLAVLTDRFTVQEVIGRAVIVHAAPDDFTTQPGGNAGARIACGVITTNSSPNP